MTAALAPPRALAFDVFGTVVDWRSGVARESTAFLSRIGRADIDPEIAATFRNNPIPTPSSSGAAGP